MMLAAFVAIAVGLILDTVTRGRREMKLLAYLEQRAPGDEWDRRDAELNNARNCPYQRCRADLRDRGAAARAPTSRMSFSTRT